MSRFRYFFRTCSIVVSLACTTVALGSCNLAKNQLTFDRAVNKDLQDYRDTLSPDGQKQAAADTAPAPDFQSVVATPSDLKLPSPLVTVSVNQTVALRDLLFELTEQAGVDLEMDPQIHGSLIFTAKERPFNEVVDRICEMAGLRYKYQSDVLRIELDRPYLKDYKVDYMSGARKSKSDISTGVSNSAAGDTTSGGGGSTSKIESETDNDFWKDMDAGLKQVLASSDNYTALASTDDPVAIPEPPPAPAQQVDANGRPVTEPAPVPSNVPPSLNVSTPAAAPAKPATTAATYTISKQTGVVSVFATERQHKLVQQFFESYRRQALTQVLIEAKVLEVSLKDEFASGIDWGSVTRNITHLGIGSVSSSTMDFTNLDTNPARTPTFTANIDFGHGWQAMVQALSTYGTVRALSSPRVTVMNNQAAMVNVAENKVYFAIKSTVTPATTTSPATVSFDSTLKTVPEGVLMSVIPTANEATGQVILAMRPTVSRQIDQISDPGITLNCAVAKVSCDPSFVPQMSVQEIDSIVKMQSGQTVVMGGLMKDSDKVGRRGIPVLGDLPVVGTLFHNHADSVQKSELVIFLHATIVPGSNIDDQDRKLYRKFGNDTRPLPM